MKREIETKFFTFNQNNSGGYYIINDDVAEFLIIEAVNADDAIRKMHSITRNYSQYCQCCGQRWDDWIEDDDGTEIPEIYGEDAKNMKDDYWGRLGAIIYYYDGTTEKLRYED